MPADTTAPLPPFDAAALAGRRAHLRLLAALVLRTMLRLGFLAAGAVAAGQLVAAGRVEPLALVAAALCLAATLLAGWGCDAVQSADEARLATRLRAAMADRLAILPPRSVEAMARGALVLSLQRHPEAIARLAVGHRAAAAMMGLGPLLAAASLCAVSWQAALAVLALTPVMILFFVLVGGTIRAAADAQERAFGHLAGQFADRIRTLPTILGNGALERETARLDARLSDYAQRTMGVLRIAFLNAGIIDFFASLSIALLAVFLGLGHLGLARIPGFSDLALWQSLLILMIAPEYFAPFRRFAEQYHVRAEGEAACTAAGRLLSPPTGPGASPGRTPAPLGDAVADWPACGLVAITGPSGAGKTTLLRQLAGIETGEGRLLPGLAAPAWVSVAAFLPEGRLDAVLAWPGVMAGAQVEAAARATGLLDPALLPGGLAAQVGAGGGTLSGGQRMRVALARALLAEGPVLADEPTAKLDPATATLVRQLLADIARDRLVVVATHDPDLAAQATHRIALSPAGGQE